MKKLRAFLFILFIGGSTAQAQFLAQMDILTPHYYPGEIYFKDGHDEAFAEVELPRMGKSKLGVKKLGTEKVYTKIDAANIVGIKIWHKDFPDSAHVLYYVPAKKALMQNEHQWGVPFMESAWGVIFLCEQNYKIDKHTGDMDIVKFVGGSYPDTPTLYYLLRAGWDKAELVIYNWDFAIRKKVAVLFADNKEISTAIKKGKLKPADMQYILDEMARNQNMDKTTMPIPKIPTDSL